MKLILLWFLLVSATWAQTVSHSEVTDEPFGKFLKYKRYVAQIDDQLYRGGFVHGPGHHSAAVAALGFNENGKPFAVLKTGDTRLSRAERGEPYVLDGFIAGRLDKKGAGAVKIALGELAEEVGGEVVPGTFQPLGAALSPTMALESTECDSYFLALVKLAGAPTGDGGSMEVTDLIGPKFLSPQQLLQACRQGGVSDASRAETMYTRSFDRIGYLPQLDLFVQDHPRLEARFRTLGLGDVLDLRSEQKSTIPQDIPAPPSKINDVVVAERDVIVIDDETRMMDAKTQHAIRSVSLVEAQGKPFPNQYLQLDYDRVKLVTFVEDPERGPLVRLSSQARPCLAFAPESPTVVRMDVEDLRIPRDRSGLPGAEPLGSPCGASAGQSDLYYHFGARRSQDSDGSYLPLARAITLCREGHGDAQTEALLVRLADELGWIPNLGMSVKEAKALESGHGKK
jgi:hypothetical protein